MKPHYSTPSGQIYLSDTINFLSSNHSLKNKVNLIITSPPFALNKKKSYGNVDAQSYCEWFRQFVPNLIDILTENGSIVIDIGGAWNKGKPTRSLYQYKLLIMLVEEYGLHLCQEHYHYNPSRLPSPIEWVNKKRIRVKDAVNNVFWLSKSPYPKANNRNILVEYSNSMKKLLSASSKDKQRRPSGHIITDNFKQDNKGAIPSNLLSISNTTSSDRYLRRCREHGIKPHPARFPDKLPEYFIKFLTDEGDLVFDPFAGSCMTGYVAEKLNRRWICCEMNEEYVRGGRLRFESA